MFREIKKRIKPLTWKTEEETVPVPEIPKTVKTEVPLYYPEPKITEAVSVPEFYVERAKYKTIIYNYPNKSVIGSFEVINEKSGGAISEVLFLTTSGDTANKDYSIQISADETVIYDGTWDYFESVSNYFQDFSAFDDGTYYVLSFNNIFYEEKIYVRIYEAGSITFTVITAKIIRRLN